MMTDGCDDDSEDFNDDGHGDAVSDGDIHLDGGHAGHSGIVEFAKR